MISLASSHGKSACGKGYSLDIASFARIRPMVNQVETYPHNQQIEANGSSPMTPAEVLVELWPKLHDIYPGLRFQLVLFENIPENARQILKNLGATAGCLVF